MNYGMNVTIWFSSACPYKMKKETLRNVTEIHYRFDNGEKVAFESNIHATGRVHFIKHIKEFETELESKKEKEF